MYHIGYDTENYRNRSHRMPSFSLLSFLEEKVRNSPGVSTALPVQLGRLRLAQLALGMELYPPFVLSDYRKDQPKGLWVLVMEL